MIITRRFVLLVGSAGLTAALLAGPAEAATTSTTTKPPSTTTSTTAKQTSTTSTSTKSSSATTATTAKSSSSTSSSPTKPAPHKSRRFVVVVGTFPSRAAAQKQVQALAAKSLKGFVIKAHTTKTTSHKTFQVVHPAASQRGAASEAKKVRAAGFKARVVAS